jgi:hypothetical protein
MIAVKGGTMLVGVATGVGVKGTCVGQGSVVTVGVVVTVLLVVAVALGVAVGIAGVQAATAQRMTSPAMMACGLTRLLSPLRTCSGGSPQQRPGKRSV